MARLVSFLQKTFYFSGGNKTTVELAEKNKESHIWPFYLVNLKGNRWIKSEVSGEGRFGNDYKLEVIKLAGKERTCLTIWWTWREKATRLVIWQNWRQKVKPDQLTRIFFSFVWQPQIMRWILIKYTARRGRSVRNS